MKSQTLLALLLMSLTDYAQPVQFPQITTVNQSVSYERLKPVMDLFRHQQAVDLSLIQAARLCHLSSSYFSRLFKQVFRCNFSEYLNQHRLYSAARWLSQTDKSITEISYELYFSSPSHFIALFKKQFGITPKQYQKEIGKRLDKDPSNL